MELPSRLGALCCRLLRSQDSLRPRLDLRVLRFERHFKRRNFKMFFVGMEPKARVKSEQLTLKRFGRIFRIQLQLMQTSCMRSRGFPFRRGTQASAGAFFGRTGLLIAPLHGPEAVRCFYTIAWTSSAVAALPGKVCTSACVT